MQKFCGLSYRCFYIIGLVADDWVTRRIFCRTRPMSSDGVFSRALSCKGLNLLLLLPRERGDTNSRDESLGAKEGCPLGYVDSL